MRFSAVPPKKKYICIRGKKKREILKRKWWREKYSFRILPSLPSPSSHLPLFLPSPCPTLTSVRLQPVPIPFHFSIFSLPFFIYLCFSSYLLSSLFYCLFFLPFFFLPCLFWSPFFAFPFSTSPYLHTIHLSHPLLPLFPLLKDIFSPLFFFPVSKLSSSISFLLKFSALSLLHF